MLVWPMSWAVVSSQGATQLDGYMIWILGVRACMGLAKSRPGLGEERKEVLNIFTMQINMVTKNKQMNGMMMVSKSRRWMLVLFLDDEILLTFSFWTLSAFCCFCFNFTLEKSSPVNTPNLLTNSSLLILGLFLREIFGEMMFPGSAKYSLLNQFPTVGIVKLKLNLLSCSTGRTHFSRTKIWPLTHSPLLTINPRRQPHSFDLELLRYTLFIYNFNLLELIFEKHNE